MVPLKASVWNLPRFHVRIELTVKNVVYRRTQFFSVHASPSWRPTAG